MKSIKIGLIGFGTVGTGVVRLLTEQRELLARRLGSPLVLKKVADLDLTRPRPVALPADCLTTRVEDILDDPEIDIVVELIGGTIAARDYVMRAIARGKHVVTANKALLAHHGNDLLAAAAAAGVEVAFEASVCGGIPIILALRQGLAANRVQELFGILNGTANYILTQMTRQRRLLCPGPGRGPGPRVRRSRSHPGRGRDRHRPQAGHPHEPGVRGPTGPGIHRGGGDQPA